MTWSFNLQKWSIEDDCTQWFHGFFVSVPDDAQVKTVQWKSLANQSSVPGHQIKQFRHQIKQIPAEWMTQRKCTVWRWSLQISERLTKSDDSKQLISPPAPSPALPGFCFFCKLFVYDLPQPFVWCHIHYICMQPL